MKRLDTYCNYTLIPVSSATIRNLPMVEKLALSQQPVGSGYTMDWIKNTKGENLFLAGLNWVTPEFVDMHEFVFAESRNIIGPGEVLVNEEFVKRMGGQTVLSVKVMGVISCRE